MKFIKPHVLFRSTAFSHFLGKTIIPSL